MDFLKKLVRKQLESMGYAIYNTRLPNVYSEDGLSTGHNHTFTKDPAFLAAYDRAKEANDGVDHMMRWRAHVAFWVAGHALQRPGSIVECGVSTGFLLSGIMQMYDWNTLGKDCYLFDTFTGLDERFTTEGEVEKGRLERYSGLKEERTRKNFEEFERINFVVGAVPETLSVHEIPEVCYLSLDMNATVPEIAAFRHFWTRLVPGGWVVLDDYCYYGYEEQHHAFNELAKELGFKILTVPTGQGLIQKPL